MDPERMTAAHRTLAFGTVVRVTAVETGHEVEVVINDRGPFVRGRIIDLSFGAARELGIVEQGVARVRVEVTGLDGNLAERRWRVQVGSFEEATRARELSTRLRAEGYSPVVLSPFEEGFRRFHRVWVGAFYERGDAERLANRLTREGHRGFVVLAAAPGQ
jgi:rare lipoprotein A